MNRISFKAMGSQMMAAIEESSTDNPNGLELVPQWFERWESRFSRFREGSELSRLNHAQGSPVVVSPLFMEVLKNALKVDQATDGLVTPFALRALEIAGYNCSFEHIHSPSMQQKDIEPSRHLPDIQVSISNRSIEIPRNTGIDLGGFVKGWAADRAARRLSKMGPALVDAGGDIAVNGPCRNGNPWPIGIQNPLNSQQEMGLILLRKGGVSTSGKDQRNWINIDGTMSHHIIDPRTGLPVITDVLSATVIATSAHLAEVAAKMTLLLGSYAGLAWLEQQNQTEAFIVLDDGEALMSSGMHQHLWRA